MIWIILAAMSAPIPGMAGENHFPALGMKTTDEDPPLSERRFGPLEKSLLFPGWGQMSERRWLKGTAFAVAELACLAGALSQDKLGNKNYNLYRTASDSTAAIRYRSLVERYDGRRNAFLLAAAAVWAVNLVDIFFIVKGKETKSNVLSLGIEHGPTREIRFSIGCRF
jgi:hypothetical protein